MMVEDILKKMVENHSFGIFFSQIEIVHSSEIRDERENWIVIKYSIRMGNFFGDPLVARYPRHEYEDLLTKTRNRKIESIVNGEE
jgi:hypothetical protein